ncbi:helix-turn-helix transcriptional regulator [Acuticoccus sp. M5D2P5]|uniref:winged helix-turn-helix transcriptional regulator n=1 Tax=Acuticoccus kalidii TaxID=2910977 RepID=UPI001F46B364|nr:helix-turn-helix domain-containing protein [Acuticoccus kalidii]MCF3933038.1 helix-turn-helix transcriptional regulator [Acuticoccus kalidii]
MKLDKVTKQAGPEPKRHYRDACAAAHALDLVGERWSLLVMREMMTGPKRFSDIKAALPGVSANILSQRLQHLEGIGVVERGALPPPAASKVYGLTPWGYQAEPILREMGRWAARSPLHDPTLPFSSASLLLSLRTMFDAARAEAAGIDARIGFQAGHERFLGHLSPRGIEIGPGDLSQAEAVIEGEAEAIAAAIYAGMPLATLETAKRIVVTGDRDILAAALRLFPLPEKAVIADRS